MLALLTAAAVGQGLWWAFALETPTPIDEQQHLGYVASLARGDGVPVVGEDRLQPDIAALSVRRDQRSAVEPQRVDPRSLGVSGLQYEGHQGPVYYATLAPLHAVVEAGWGLLPALYADRILSVLLAALAVPGAWWLAREALPRLPAAAPVAAGLLVVVPGAAANTASVTNDALVAPFSVALLALTARALRTGATWRAGAVTGVVAGLGVLVKVTVLGAVVLAGVAVVVTWMRRAEQRRALSGWVGAATAGGVLVLIPWLVWNRLAYAGDSAAERVLELIIAPIQGTRPLTLASIGDHLSLVRIGLFEPQVIGERGLPDLGWVAVGLVLGVALIAVVVDRRRRDRWWAVAWLATAMPVIFAVHLTIVFATIDGGLVTIGRMLLGALPASAVAGAGAAILLLGDRWGPVAAVGAGVGFALALAPLGPRYLDNRYVGGADEPARAFAAAYHPLHPDLALSDLVTLHRAVIAVVVVAAAVAAWHAARRSRPDAPPRAATVAAARAHDSG